MNDAWEVKRIWGYVQCEEMDMGKINDIHKKRIEKRGGRGEKKRWTGQIIGV
jgi:hypothetical protein